VLSDRSISPLTLSDSTSESDEVGGSHVSNFQVRGAEWRTTPYY
jgi:hypothetical protein